MNTKGFTLQQGFVLPILKSLTTLNKESLLSEITECMTSKNLFAPRESDLEKIDFNDKVRFISAVENIITELVKQGYISLKDNLYSVTPSGIQKLESEWAAYNQNDFVKTVNVANVNKYVYFNMPPYLLHTGQKQVTVLGFKDHEREYIKFLNDFIDYIDLNYPLMDEMINFLKFTYDFQSQESCLNAINIIRSCGLVKVMGKNLSLTKLGQWYINSYSSIALFRIFANRYIGFEEILCFIASNDKLSSDSLKDKLINQYKFDWANSDQLDIRLNWLSDMNITTVSEGILSLSNDALCLAEYLGFIDIPSNKNTSQVSSDLSESAAKTKDELFENVVEELNTDDFNLSFELGNIVEDIVSQSDETEFIFESDIVEESDPSSEVGDASNAKDNNELTDIFNTTEPDILENISLIGTSSDEFDTNLSFGTNSSPIEPEKVQADAAEKTSINPVVVKIPVKETTLEQDKDVYLAQDVCHHDDYITPEEISSLVSLPREVTAKIVCALNMDKHIVLTGPHGSGKTSIAVILAKIAQQKGLNNGYNLFSATECMSSSDTVGALLEIGNTGLRKVFKEGVILKSIRENKWLIIDEIGKCDTSKCFNDFINAFYGYNTVLPYMHHNHKNIEIISDTSGEDLGENQYFKSKDWRMIATMDTSEKHDISFSPAFIRRFAFIEIGFNNYSKVIDEYFIKTELQNDILKNKVKAIFSQEGLLKFKDVGSSSIYDLIKYISIRSKIMAEKENIHEILAEGLELYILPQLRILDKNILNEAQEYLISLFESHSHIKEYIKKAL